MSKILSFFLAFLMIFSCCGITAIAENKVPSFVAPSIVASDIYEAYGNASICYDLTKEEFNSIKEFHSNIVDVVKLEINQNDNENYFFIKGPAAQNEYSWFLIDDTGLIVGNLVYIEIEENWFQVKVDFWTNYQNTYCYLVWVE